MKRVKQTLKWLILFSGISLFLSSCQTDEEHFSHNKEINDWIIENKTSIKNFKRVDFVKYGYKYQKAMLKLQTPERKKSLWQEKVDYLMELNLPSEERKCISWFAEKFKSMNYNISTPREIEIEMLNKIKEGVDNFGWSKDFIFTMFFSLGDVDIDTRKDFVKEGDDDGNDIKISDTDCDCISDWGCPGWDGECFDKDCKEPQQNCGVFGGSECTGNCNQSLIDYE